MPTTEQRTGFRLPWTADARPASPAEDQEAVAEPAGRDDVTTLADAAAPRADAAAEPAPLDPRDLPWPDSDAPTDQPDSASTEAAAAPAAPVAPDPSPAPTAPGVRARRDNPLVAGLVRAMREAAASARQDATARFAEQAKARLEAIHSTSADEASALRKEADTAIVKIRDWSKAEMARIREETDTRIAERRRRLASDVDAHAARVEHRIERLQAASRQFETRLDAFFEELLAEEDPAQLAGLAEQLPEPPSLDFDDDDALASERATFDAGGAAAAEAEAFADLDGSDLADADQPDVEAMLDRLGAMATAPEAAPEAVTTGLSVVGLASVASIAGFKRALARIHGVRSVSVASGPGGDFVFTVAHDPETDLRSAIPAIPGFAAVIGPDADGVVTVTATDPEGGQ